MFEVLDNEQRGFEGPADRGSKPCRQSLMSAELFAGGA